MISIETIIAVASAFMFAALVIPFIIDVSSSAEQEGLGSFEISDEQQMAELIAHTTLISYVCTEESEGGYHEATQTISNRIFWTSWKNYYDLTAFDNLEEYSAQNQLECHGSPNKLPLSEGLTDAFLKGVGVGADNWIDSQKGQHSRKEFIINVPDDEDYVAIPKCVHLADVDPDISSFADGMVWAITDNNADSITRMREGRDNFDDCQEAGALGEPDFSTSWGYTNVGHLTTNVIVVEDLKDDFYDHPRADRYSGNYPEAGSLDYIEFKLCDGTTGYVQSNPGTNEEAEAPATGFSVEDNVLPGVPDRTTGSEDEVNRPHPYIVITNAPDDCF